MTPLVALLAVGCTVGDSNAVDDTAAPVCEARSGDPEWSLVADRIDGGVLLSAWSDGGEAILVGGETGGGSGLIARWTGDALCTEPDVTDRALWWIHGAAPGAWYAVGERGLILHDTGGSTRREDVDTDATLYGVWDTGTDVWAVGGVVATGTGEVWRRRDGTWTRVLDDAPGLLFKVWDGFIVGDHVSYTIDGDTLVPHDLGERVLTARGRSATDVWAVGGTGSARVLHWEGSSWDPVDATGLGAPLNGVWTAPGEDVWIAGTFGVVGRRVGEAWELAGPPPSTESFHAAWKHCDEMLFVGGNLFATSGHYGTIVRHGPPIDPIDEVTECR